MLELKDVTIAINDKVMIAHLNLALHDTDKLAIIGEEGNGKSTLMKAIMGIADYATIQGNIHFQNQKIAYLKQSLDYNDLEKNVFSFVFYNEETYYQQVAQMYSLLPILSIEDSILEKQMSVLSGGEKVKVQLLKLLLAEPDILLLDEPTNDLDIKTLQYLEHFINTCDKPIMYISHDETLLANTANRILHLELRKKKQEAFHTLVSMDYDSYIEERLSLLTRQTKIAYGERREHKKKMDKLMRQMQQVDHQLNSASRQDPHAAQLLKKKMRNVKAHEKRITSEEISEVPDVEEHIEIFFPEVSLASRKQIIDLHLDGLYIQNKPLTQAIDFVVYGPKHIVIVGQNGVGKTTLLKQIKATLDSRDDLYIGYMPQDYDSVLAAYNTPIDFLAPSRKQEDITFVRKCLGNLNFTRDEMSGNIQVLSGGSKAKLILLSLILQSYDVLLLDEPTRNVSPLSNPIIREALKQYKGCIISISHDRKYINEVCDEIYELTKSGLHKKTSL